MYGIHLCDVDIIDIKLSDNVALYLFCFLGLAWVWFVRKVLGWIRLGWVGSLRKWVGSGYGPANWTHVHVCDRQIDRQTEAIGSETAGGRTER